MKINLEGAHFGRWVVLRAAEERKGGQLCWVCRCECGTEKTISGFVLRNGGSKSCGCLRRELGVAMGKSSRRHGESANSKIPVTPEYAVWGSMKSRCQNPNHKQFSHYGGRGIKVCERWQRFENFLTDVGRRPSEFHSLDRINNDGDYEPGNVRWATYEQQNNNTRGNRRITIRGETKTLAEWIKNAPVGRTAFSERIKRGMSAEEALFTPPMLNNGILR